MGLVLGLQREHVAAPPTKIQGPLITKFSETFYHLGKVKLTTTHTIRSSQNILHTLLHTKKKMFSHMSQLYLFLSTPLTVDKKQHTNVSDPSAEVKVYYPKETSSLLLCLENTSPISKPQIQSLTEPQILWHTRVS